jgi:hypothetical protein
MAQRRPQPTAARSSLRHRGKRKVGAQRPRVGRRPASPAPPGAPRIRARGQGAYRVWKGKEGAVGNRECQESVRRFLRETGGRATPVGRWEGRGDGVATPHEVGTTRKTRKDRDRQIDAGKAGAREPCGQLILSEGESGGMDLLGLGITTDEMPAGPGRPSMLMLLY